MRSMKKPTCDDYSSEEPSFNFNFVVSFLFRHFLLLELQLSIVSRYVELSLLTFPSTNFVSSPPPSSSSAFCSRSDSPALEIAIGSVG